MSEKKYKIKLQAGDYCSIENLSLEQYEALGKRFIDAGANNENEYFPAFDEKWNFIGWDLDGDIVHNNEPSEYGRTRRRLWKFDEIMELAEPEPQAEWNGEGNPPAGTACKYRLNGCEWEWCRIVHHSGCASWIVTKSEDRIIRNDLCEFRPLKTERELAIEAMRELCAEVEKTLTPPAHGKTPEEREKLHKDGFEKMIGAAFDAGLLKLPEQQK